MKILIVDSYYPDVIKQLSVNPALNYEQNLRHILDFSFGTGDGYSRNLRALGWDAVDVIANHQELQSMWARENGKQFTFSGTALDQIRMFKPDVVFLQDLSWFDPETMSDLAAHYLLAGQCSCPWPGRDRAIQLNCAFTSFPHFVKRFEDLSVRAIYNPLAFEPSVLDKVDNKVDRIHDVVFIGGVGAPSHWNRGMEVLETVAREIPTFKWWGYGLETLPADSALRSKYQGEAYGLDLYEILLRSKIAINRHGEVAEGYANNMRMFEATGCGAMLLTDGLLNLGDFFTDIECVDYGSPQAAVDSIRYWLDEYPEGREGIAADGQARTLRDHTYAQRMKVVSETLKEMLCPV